MGYTTDFTGHFTVNPPLAPEHAAYLTKFNETRRMRRYETTAESFPDPVRIAAKLAIGHHGCFFVGGEGSYGQAHDASVSDYNNPPLGQPGLWCQWRPSKNPKTGAFNRIEWDGAEKFYNYVEWLEYLIDVFLRPWGYTLFGSVRWQGEDYSDRGEILVFDNEVAVRTAERGPYRDIDQALDEVQVETRPSAGGFGFPYAVVDGSGVLACFPDPERAHHYRLFVINCRLNPEATK